jgi:metal-responsive CopG/Arc/MetJ family transcriptional regulator
MKKVRITVAIKEELLTKIDEIVRERQLKELESGGIAKSNRSNVIEELLETAILNVKRK